MAPEVNKPTLNAAVRNTPPANNKPAANAPAANAPAANAPSDNAPVANATAADPVENTTTVEAPKKKDHNHFMGFFEGFVKEGAETVAGLYTLVTTNPITTAKGLVYMATHPAQAVQAITEPYTTAYKDGRYGELAGRVGFQVLTVVLTSGALSKSDKASKVAKPTANMTATATKVTEDLAQKIGAKRAASELAKGTLKGAAYNKKLASLTAKYTEQAAANLAKRGIADKLAVRIAGTGLGDDMVTKIMTAGGSNVSASQAYRYGAAGLKHGMKPAEIAANLAKFGISKEAAAKLPAATRVLFAAGTEAGALGMVGSAKSAEKIAAQLTKLDRMAASSTDKAVKAAAKAQADAIRAALAGHPATDRLVTAVMSGEKIGTFKRLGASIDNGIDDVARTGKNIAEGGSAVKNALNRPNTIGGYVEAIGAIPTAIGHGLHAAYQGTINTLRAGMKMLPKFEMPKISWEKIAATRVPSPWEILTAPVTVPLGTAGWALRNPGRALGVAGIAGNIGNTAKAGERLEAREAKDKVDPDDTGAYKWYELKDGDTLGDIAKRELGDFERWPEIVEANKELFESLGDEGVLAVGTKIKIPTGGATPAPTGDAAADYKAALLKLIDDEAAAATDAEAKDVLAALKAKIGGMTPEEVYALKPKLEEQGLVVDVPAKPPANNGPSANNPPANKPGTNTPPANTPGANAPANKPPANAPAGPPANVPAGNDSQAPQTRPYTVKRGDTLTGIADQELGNWQRWREIVDLNQTRYPGLGANPDYIGIGWKLDLPVEANKPAAPAAPAAPPSPTAPKPPAAPAAPPANAPVGNTNGTVVPRPGANAPANAPAVNAPPAPTGAQRQEIVKQFNLQAGDANFGKFWGEISQYPTTTTGPDTGTEADRKGLQGLLGKLGYDVQPTGDYYVKGPDGKPRTDANGLPVSPTAEAVVHFKRLAGISQGYNVMGPDGKPVADVNEYVDQRTRESMVVALRLLQNPGVRQQANMEAAVREAARLQQGAIGPEVGSKDARTLVQRYLDGLGYRVPTDGTWDQATVDALVEFKRKAGIAASYKDDQGRPVYTPYVDGRTADALYNAIKQLGTKK